MIKGIYTIASGMLPQVTKIEVLSHNLANINTAGFKKDKVFTEVLNEYQAARTLNSPSAPSLAVHQTTDFSEGSYQQTGNRLDFAIRGNGFFAIETPRGIRYTRNGSFTLSLDGTVVTQEGYPVLGTEGKIQLPDLQRLSDVDIQVNEAGDVVIDNKHMGRLQIVSFDSMTVLKKDAATLFYAQDGVCARTLSQGEYAILQGYLEESNVEGIDEMILMIEVNRNFESGQKAIQAQDETLERLFDVPRV
ncbi:MAG: flagellar basal-body rod protein FlgF [Bacteroidetes bacterium]|nr:flagellar basal-body rod protein FlgF [Bacteroidota bacterium]